MPDPGPGKSDWTLRTLFDHFQARVDDLRKLFDFFQHRMEDADKRYEQRFDAQQEAVQAALVGQEKAVNAALIAADRAVTKAELSAEKRFEAVNEFRAALSDQATLLIPRAEAEQRLKAMQERFESMTTTINDRVSRLESAQSARAGETHQSETSGQKVMWGVGIAVAIVLALVSVFSAFLAKH